MPTTRCASARSSTRRRRGKWWSRKGIIGPLRLYTGNPRAEAPHYNFAASLPPVLQPPPERIGLGPTAANPVYRPEPKPLSERWPWLVYVVLGTASAVLLLILGLLARQMLRRHNAEWAAGTAA